jgi:histidinol-phosphatase (PHP family)
MTYKTDYHIHTTFSDGKAPATEYIKPALSAGLNEIGFSEHLSLFREKQEWCMNPSNVNTYIKYIDSLKEEYSDIKIKTGLEIDYIPGGEKELESFLGDLDLDYRIGSVHYFGDKTVDMNPDFYYGKDFNVLFADYFKIVIAAASSGLFDIIGHCDLIRIFGYKPEFDPEDLYRDLARSFKKNDVVFELNTNGRNRPLADFYPDRRFLHIFAEEKVSVCINSDAHIPVRVGQYFDEAYGLLKQAGFTETATFRKRQRIMKQF